MLIMARVSHKPSFKESNVENGGIEVDKLEKENQVLIIVFIDLKFMMTIRCKRFNLVIVYFN